MGQTVRLTCTSTSLPPASFSWELNGQPVTASQSGSGVLNLQIFSTNQSGTYACTARNDITGGASKQQIDLAIVGELMALCGTRVTDASVSSFFGLTFIFMTGEGVISYRIDKFMCHHTGRIHNFHPPTLLCRILSPVCSIIDVSVMFFSLPWLHLCLLFLGVLANLSSNVKCKNYILTGIVALIIIIFVIYIILLCSCDKEMLCPS